MSELGLAVKRDGIGQLEGVADIVPELCVNNDVVRASVLAAWADILTGLLAVDVVGPRVPVTLQLDLDLYRPPVGLRRVVMTAKQVKAGKTVFVAGVDFADDEGDLFGAATGLFVVSPDPGLRMATDENPVDFVAGMGNVESLTLSEPFADRVGCVRGGAGEAILPLREDSLNASHTLNGGLIALVVEEAARSVLAESSLSMLALRYLKPVRIGPAVATAQAHGKVAKVSVRDDGRSGALAVSATARPF